VCLSGPPAWGGEPEALPGPGLDVPVDADGDGLSTHGDRYVFNYWLELGGDLGTALKAAEAGKDGIIDLGKFFSSPDALLKPRVEVVEAEPTEESGSAGGAEAASSGCATEARLVAPFGDLTRLPSVLGACQTMLSYPTGAAVDKLQGLWFSRGRPGDDPGTRGVAFFTLSQVPPMGQNGTIPIESPAITQVTGYGAEAIVVREVPASDICYHPGSTPLATHAMTTWSAHDLICRSPRYSTGLCGGIFSEVGFNSVEFGSEPPIENPFALDVVRDGMPAGFRDPDPMIPAEKNLIFSDYVDGDQMIRRAVTHIPGQQYGSTVKILAIIQEYIVRGLALGDFKGAGDFAAYYIGQGGVPIQSRVRKLIPLQGGGFADEHVTLLDTGYARAIAFDPFSGYLFVSEDRGYDSSGTAWIWRVGPTGPPQPFGKWFHRPNGIAFHPSGVMLVAEETFEVPPTGNVVVVGGWRTRFKRGDANGSGVVDISDPIAIGNWLNDPTNPMKALACWDGADANDDSFVNGVDRTLILEYLFSGGPPPALPGPLCCGTDPTPDLLDCTKCLATRCGGGPCAIQ
jgi:hypothetical protein